MGLISNCCNASPLYENFDICGDCKEHATFFEEDNLELMDAAESIATHNDLAQEVIYLIEQATELEIEERWILVNHWLDSR